MTILLLACLGGLVAIIATVSVEKFGGKLGGLISSLPSTIIPCSIGFWLSSSEMIDFTQSVMVIPWGMFVNALFLFSWRWFPPRLSAELSPNKKLSIVVILSLLVWMVGAFLLVFLWDFVQDPFLWGWLGALSLLSFGIVSCLNNPPAPKGSKKISLFVLFNRGLLASCTVGLSIWLSSLGVPVLAGMSAVFPAIYLTAMVSIWLAQGEDVQTGAIGPMILGSVAVASYAILSGYLYPLLGIGWGAVLCWLLSVGGVSVPAWWFLQRIQKK